MDDGIFELMNKKPARADSGMPLRMGSIRDDVWGTVSMVNPAGSRYKLGKNAVWIWRSCDGARSRDSLTTAYASEFNIGKAEAKTDSEAILSSLERMGLISTATK